MLTTLIVSDREMEGMRRGKEGVDEKDQRNKIQLICRTRNESSY